MLDLETRIRCLERVFRNIEQQRKVMLRVFPGDYYASIITDSLHSAAKYTKRLQSEQQEEIDHHD